MSGTRVPTTNVVTSETRSVRRSARLAARTSTSSPQRRQHQQNADTDSIGQVVVGDPVLPEYAPGSLALSSAERVGLAISAVSDHLASRAPNNEQAAICTICMDEPTAPASLVPCGHVFCTVCIQQHLLSLILSRPDEYCPSYWACPNCRKEIEDIPKSHGDEGVSSEQNLPTASISAIVADSGKQFSSSFPTSPFTPLGKIKFWLPFGKGCRVIVNAGTNSKYMYEMHRGAVLGPGTKAMLEDNHAFRKVPNYGLNAIARCQAVANATEALLDVIDYLPHGRDVSRTVVFVIAKFKERQTFDETQREYAVLTESQCAQIWGDAETARLISALRSNRRIMKYYLDCCMRGNLHPDTGMSLTEHDPENRGWLTRQSARIFSSTGQRAFLSSPPPPPAIFNRLRAVR